MATATKRRTSTRKPKAQLEVVPDVDENEDVIEDLGGEDDVVEDDAPAPKEKKASAPKKDTKGTTWLVEHTNEKLGTEVSGFAARAILRRMTRDGELNRDARSRYEFEGPNDPAVKAFVKHVQEGPVKAEKAEGEKKAPAKKASRKKAAPEPVEEEVIADDLDDLDDLDLDDE